MALQLLREMTGKTADEILRAVNSSRGGLSDKEAAARRKEYGPNELAAKRKANPLLLFLSEFRNPIIILLAAAAIASGFLGSPVDAGLILAIVLASALVDFADTYRSSRAAEKLRDRVVVTADVRRGGEESEIPIREVVPGDIILLAAGDVIPADGVLIEGRDVFADESALTGESLPAEKEPGGGSAAVFRGTSVVSGRGVMVAVRTGKETELGKIAEKLLERAVPGEFERNLKDFSIFIFRLTLAIVLGIFLLNVLFEHKGLLETFLFAVAIAIGLTPELLPMIVSTNLAKGALRMSRHGVIVKKLSAIHNFGSVDVFCSDKTGTLTEDKIELVRYLDPLGREDEQVLFWGAVSSAFVSSVRGTLDQAIRERKKIEAGEWEKVDEFPFDFRRRRDSVAVRAKGETTLVIKGAPEDVMKICKFCGRGGKEFTGPLRREVEARCDELSRGGFRVLGVALKKLSGSGPYKKEAEEGADFLGFLAFLDPPKKTAKAVLEKMRAYGVAVKIITGDNALVAQKIAGDLDLPAERALTGDEIEGMSDAELQIKAEEAVIFARVLPDMKERIIRALRAQGHVVGYLGDGVNDVLSLRAADVGISVQNAVDVAKETADLILLKKGLNEIIEGIIEGRKTFANTFKYLLMALSSNFGNMLSMPLASLFLPFLPMAPAQILLNNFLYDGSQFAIPFDNVDENFLLRPKKFDIGFMKRFMVVFGPLSSLFDGLTFFVLLRVAGFWGSQFQTGWFLESIATQTFVVSIIRTRKGILSSRPGAPLVLAACGAVAVAWMIPFTGIGSAFGFSPVPVRTLGWITLIVAVYLVFAEIAKRWFYAVWGGRIER